MKNNSIFYEDDSLDDYEPLREASNAALNRIIRSMDNFSYVIISSEDVSLDDYEPLREASNAALNRIIRSMDNFSYVIISSKI